VFLFFPFFSFSHQIYNSQHINTQTILSFLSLKPEPNHRFVPKWQALLSADT